MSARYRIAVFGNVRSPWRDTVDEAMADAVKLELASWDDSRREWFLAVPVELQVDRSRSVLAAWASTKFVVTQAGLQ